MSATVVWLRMALIVLGLAMPGAVAAQAAPERTGHPAHGLMWNRTGLPGVFPLQVKTIVGVNHLLLLSDPDTGTDALAAFIVGGRFFKVLVPPGTYRVRFASGVRWQGEDAMFGRQGETNIIEMPEALTFEVRGLGTKAGHLIDLTQGRPGELAQLHPAPLSICQRIEWIADRCDTRLRPSNAVMIGCEHGGYRLASPGARFGRMYRVRTSVCP